MSTPFRQVIANEALLDNLNNLNFTEMTVVQERSLKDVLAGKDCIVLASTGSGKTLAFALGVLNNLNENEFNLQALILAPTRDLVEQIAEDIRVLARYKDNVKVTTLIGGKPLRDQADALEKGAQIAVGTPGRIVDHITKGTIILNDINSFVLDECDRMLDMGFEEEMHNVMKFLPHARQNLLFSATLGDGLEKMANKFMNRPKKIYVNDEQKPQIKQTFYACEEKDKFETFKAILTSRNIRDAIIFCNTKVMCDRVSDNLQNEGFSAHAFHADYTQEQRDELLLQFINGSINLLVCTDVAARGIDISELDAVFNYEMAHEAKNHTHRIGRTARAGHSGAAISLVANSEMKSLKGIEEESDEVYTLESIKGLKYSSKYQKKALFRTLKIRGGKKDKLRPGDIVGALSVDGALNVDDIGKISVKARFSYLAVKSELVDKAHKVLNAGKIKGKKFKVWYIEESK